jgi:hypothetical protein
MGRIFLEKYDTPDVIKILGTANSVTNTKWMEKFF